MDMLKTSIYWWQMYWNNNKLEYIYFLALLFLLVICIIKKKKSLILFTAYQFFVLFIFFCPLTTKIFIKFIDDYVYWRIIWLLLIYSVIAIAMVELLILLKAKWKQYLAIGLFCLLVMVTGTWTFTGDKFVKVVNHAQVPEEVAVAAELIRSDAAEGEKILAAADEYMASYLRVYDASIYMPYSRGNRSHTSGYAKLMYSQLCDPNRNDDKVIRLAEKIGCTHLIFQPRDQQEIDDLVAKGLTLLGQVNNYAVFSCS